MVISKKDKKLIILILSTIITLWFLGLVISSIFTKVSFDSSKVKILTDNHSKWLNSSRQIESSDLKNRVILLDFWTYACVNCLHMVPEIKKLETEFGNRLTVIGVHSGKFNNEKNDESIKKAIIKNDISHLVVNDSEFKIWNGFKVSSWPSFVLIDAKGHVVKKYDGEISAENLRKDIKKLIKKYKYRLNSERLPIILEKNRVADYILKFPGEIIAVQNFSYKNINKINALIISNTGKNKILVTNLNGNILLEIGSGEIGFDDGDLDSSSFNSPRGLLFKDNILYVADTSNHAIRKINFTDGKVSTLIGSGKRGEVVKLSDRIDEISLSSPFDLAFFPDKNNIVISNSGTHQLLKYNIPSNTIIPFAGNGSKGLVNGHYPDNSLAQPSGLSSYGSQLYFVDAESSSLRSISKNGLVKTLIGHGLSEFGHRGGKKDKALMQHPVGVIAFDKEIYISDTHNHAIRRYNIKTGELSTYSGGERGDGVSSGKRTEYDEPEAITYFADRFYIVDTNNNRVMELAKNNGNAKILNIMPRQKLPADYLLEYLPNLEKLPSKAVRNIGQVKLIFNLKKGWKINDEAPSFFNLVEVKNKKEANLIASFNDTAIKSGSVKLPNISSENTYYLQGTVYYCEDKANALCLIRSYEQKLSPSLIGSDEIKINFTY